jgi:hypothetical protein
MHKNLEKKLSSNTRRAGGPQEKKSQLTNKNKRQHSKTKTFLNFKTSQSSITQAHKLNNKVRPKCFILFLRVKKSEKNVLVLHGWILKPDIFYFGKPR